MKNEPIYNQEGKIIAWKDRSIAVAGFVFLYHPIDKSVYVLANKRGKGTPDYQGYWNCPCGYLDWDETLAEACCREIKEETGLQLYPASLIFIGINDAVEASKQNVTMRFAACLITNDWPELTTENSESEEVEKVEWIPLNVAHNYQWAFNHDEIIRSINIPELIKANIPNIPIPTLEDVYK